MGQLDGKLRLATLGDRAATQAVLRELLPRVRNMIHYLVRREDDLDDIAQDALVAITLALPECDANDDMFTWADHIVTWTALNAMRRAREHDAVTPQLETIDASRMFSAQRLHDRRSLLLHLERLSLELRHALVLHHVLEMSVPEIARELGIPIETVRSRLRLGRAKMRSFLLADDEATDEPSPLLAQVASI